MKCDVCQAEATVFLTQIINSQMTTVNLCEECSKSKGVTDDMGFGLAEAFIGPGSHSHTTNTDPSCPACGFTAQQLKKIGRMGCPECYDAFRNGLDSLLQSMHKGTRHIGKIPQNLAASARHHGNVKQLRADMATAIAEERYEDAGVIKAQLDALLSPAPTE
ncbi:MAG: UvrB/UvrC motif-containing protein [Verrucomicrobiales bacterium]|nr:UvrB/UvrC motif-containing protein [Verrucomicrobiales bacterium]MCP5558026.1 UvrB/UvrC motif-containing protein [Verrucomicrobiaceae bacterium]